MKAWPAKVTQKINENPDSQVELWQSTGNVEAVPEETALEALSLGLKVLRLVDVALAEGGLDVFFRLAFLPARDFSSFHPPLQRRQLFRVCLLLFLDVCLPANRSSSFGPFRALPAADFRQFDHLQRRRHVFADQEPKQAALRNAQG